MDLAIALDRAMRGDSDEAVEVACLAIASARAAALRDDLDLIRRVRAEGPDMVAAAVELLARWLGERAGERRAAGDAS